MANYRYQTPTKLIPEMDNEMLPAPQPPKRRKQMVAIDRLPSDLGIPDLNSRHDVPSPVLAMRPTNLFDEFGNSCSFNHAPPMLNIPPRIDIIPLDDDAVEEEDHAFSQSIFSTPDRNGTPSSAPSRKRVRRNPSLLDLTPRRLSRSLNLSAYIPPPQARNFRAESSDW